MVAGGASLFLSATMVDCYVSFVRWCLPCPSNIMFEPPVIVVKFRLVSLKIFDFATAKREERNKLISLAA